MNIVEMPLHEALVVCLAARSAPSGPALAELSFGLAGAVMTDLWLAGRLELDGKRVRLVDPTPIGRQPYDDVIARIAAEPKPRRPKWWVWHLARLRVWTPAIAAMQERGTVTVEPHRNRIRITTQRIVGCDARTRNELVAELVECCAADGGDIRTRSLLSLAWTMSQNVTSGYERPATISQVSRLSRDLWPALAVAAAFADTY